MRWVGYQLRYLADRSAQKCVLKSRRVGFTEVIGFERALRFVGLQMWPGVEAAIVTPVSQNLVSASLEQSKDMLARTMHHVKALLRSGAVRKAKVTKESATIVEATIGGHRVAIRAHSSNPRTIRSYEGDVVLDEFASCRDQDGVWAAVAPMTKATLGNRDGFQLVVSSTPLGDDNRFFEMASGRYSKSFSQHVVDVHQAVADGFPITVSRGGVYVPGTIDDLREEIGDDDTFAQEFECFPPGTLVATPRGHVAIELLRPGDCVLTHRGRWRPIKSTMKRRYRGSLIEITAFGNQAPIRCTPNHPFLVYDRRTQSRSWRRARDLDTSDYLVLPKSNTPFCGVVTETMARIIAWFICEGSVNGNAVYFSLNGNNAEEIAEVRGLLRALGFESKWYVGRKPSAGSLVVCSASLADALTVWCGAGAENKRIPFDLIRGHEGAFFDTMIAGDGCIVVREREGDFRSSKRYAFTTISKGLALDMQALAGTLGRRAGIVVRPACKSMIEGRQVNSAQSYAVQITRGFHVNHPPNTSRHALGCFPTKLGIAYRVRSIERVDYSGAIHNLSVKSDESYVAEGRAVHNCSFLSASQRYISADVYDAACYDDDELPENFNAPGKALMFAGIDVARVKDRTALARVGRMDATLWQERDVEVLRDTPWDEQETWADERLRDCANAAVDASSIGSQFCERLQNRWGASRIEAVNFTAKSKEQLASGLKLGLSRKKLRPRASDIETRREVLSMRRDIADSGVVRYLMPRGKSGHGDRAWALALAARAAGGSAHDHKAPNVTTSVELPDRPRADPFLRPKRGGLWK